MEWDRGSLALITPPSLGQSWRQGRQRAMGAENCLPAFSPRFLLPVSTSPSQIHSLPSPL